MRPSTRLFHVRGIQKADSTKSEPQRQPMPNLDIDISWDEAAPPGVTFEAWHKARGWASED